MSESLRSRLMLVCVGFLVIAGFFLITEHRAHTFGVLPFVFLLACPLLHLASHGGHHHHGPPDGGDDHHASSDKGGTQ